MVLFLTIDVGTSYLKTSIFDENCNLVFSRVNEYEIISPKFDYLEVDPIEYYNALKSALKEFA